MNWLLKLINRMLDSRIDSLTAQLEPTQIPDDEFCPECGGVHQDMPEDYFDQPLSEEDSKEIISGVMETWTNLFEVINGRKPDFDELNSQYLVSNFALEQANSLMPGLYMMAEGVTAEEGYATPPPWAVKIARGVLLEYLSGNMNMVSQVIKKNWESN